ncbi:MAG: ABC transporter substrate-binding protein [Alphaproteobacteria bacterium]|nr:ABC transporter substrate-binding protein [Alphaproteobacteria bacterium]
MKSTLTLWTAKFLFVMTVGIGLPTLAEPMHGVALYGEPKYAAGFEAFDYVNPNAPKGGTLHQAFFGAFDTLNPFVINGVAAPGTGLMHDTLMKQNADEAFSLYGLIADTIDISEDRQTVSFHLNPAARFSDGSPITAKDVLFSFNILKEKGVPMYRAYYRDVLSVEVPADDTVIFHLSPTTNRELPLILGELPILSEAYWKNRDFTQTSLDIPVSSGPYLIKKIVPNRSITYIRNPKYWAKNLNVNRGSYNFDEIQYDLYRDTTVAVEAFKAGLLDIRMENEAKKWHVLSNSEPVLAGKMKARVFKHNMPSGMQGFVFNLRRPKFQDIRVRKALATVFDFDWTNHNLFYDSYRRTESYFENSFLKAPPLPDENELKLLEPFQKQLPPSTLNTPYEAPGKKDNRRTRLTKALTLLEQAGYYVDKRGVLRSKSGQPFEFEILIDSASGPVWERIILPYIDRLKHLGITATVRTVDTIQYKNRLDTYDYDMIVTVWGQSFSPGNEQRYFWGSAAADTEGSLNYSGIKSPVIDFLIDRIIGAESQSEHLTAVHALDRVLLHSHLVIPHWHTPEHRYLYWDKFGIPDTVPMKGMNILDWWIK